MDKLKTYYLCLEADFDEKDEFFGGEPYHGVSPEAALRQALVHAPEMDWIECAVSGITLTFIVADAETKAISTFTVYGEMGWDVLQDS